MPTYDHSITDFSRITDLLNVNFIPLKSVQFLPRLCAWISIAADKTTLYLHQSQRAAQCTLRLVGLDRKLPLEAIATYSSLCVYLITVLFWLNTLIIWEVFYCVHLSNLMALSTIRVTVPACTVRNVTCGL